MKKGLVAVACFQALLSVCLVGKPLDIDEPLYIAMARQASRDPLHPGALRLFWEGRTETVSRIVASPPLASWLYGAALAAVRGDEQRLRLGLIPVDALAAVFLYLLAARFLKHPLPWTLAVLAGPGWWLTIAPLMLEKWMILFGLASLYAAARSSRDEPDGWWWASAALAALAAFAKYNGLIFPVAAAAYFAARGVPPRRIVAWLAAALAPAALYLAGGLADAPWLHALRLHASTAASPGLVHRARASLAFAAGCVPAIALWAWPASPPRRWLGVGAAAGAALFLPPFDSIAATGADRAFGLALGACSGAALATLAGARPRTAEETSWRALAGASLLLELFVLWSVAARFSLFASAGIALALAARIEESRPAAARRLAWGGVLLSLPLGAAAQLSDAAHASASRLAATSFAGGSGRSWFTGHWGFQHYMEAAGARPLDPARGGWDEVHSGDVVVVPGVNTNVVRPLRPQLARVRVVEPSAPLPFLLMCGARWRCQAGFYSSAYGFLPFSLSREPVDRFEIVELGAAPTALKPRGR